MNPAIAQFSDDPIEEAYYQEHQERLGKEGYCVFCHQPVEPGRDYRRVYGWVGGAGKDGFRRDGYGDEWAHKHCIDINKTVGAGQGALDV